METLQQQQQQHKNGDSTSIPKNNIPGAYPSGASHESSPKLRALALPENIRSGLKLEIHQLTGDRETRSF